jgi:uncharacterized protein YjbI with pentapeptide repeats
VISFLHESGLIARSNPIVGVHGADLRELNLRGVMLVGAVLLETNLRRVNLSGAILQGAILQRADLRGANL